MNSFQKWILLGSIAILGYVALNDIYKVRFRNGIQFKARNNTHEIGFRASDNAPYFTLNHKGTTYSIDHSLDNQETTIGGKRGKWEGRVGYDFRKHVGSATGKRNKRGLEARVAGLYKGEKPRVDRVYAYTPRKHLIYPS